MQLKKQKHLYKPSIRINYHASSWAARPVDTCMTHSTISAHTSHVCAQFNNNTPIVRGSIFSQSSHIALCSGSCLPDSTPLPSGCEWTCSRNVVLVLVPWQPRDTMQLPVPPVLLQILPLSLPLLFSLPLSPLCGCVAQVSLSNTRVHIVHVHQYVDLRSVL